MKRSAWIAIAAIALGAVGTAGLAQPAGTKSASSVLVQESAKRATAIVFVHGGGGSANETWRNAKSNKSWPEWMIGDDAFRDTSIFAYDYASPYLEAALNIGQLAVEMHAVLRDRGILDHERIVFVAHSMGGLVVKSFLLTFRQYTPRVQFVYFLGVPSKGTEVTRFAHLVSRNPQPREVASLDSFLQQQLTQWRVMHSPVPAFPIYCAYEELPTPGIGARIVDLSSAVEGCFEAPEAILADHISMVKPRDRDTTTYVLFRDKYRKEAQRIASRAERAESGRQLGARERAASFLTKGLAAAAQGNSLGAIEMYAEAIRIDPNYERAYFWRGQSYATSGNRKRAAEDLRRALELKLDDPQDRALAERLLQRLTVAETSRTGDGRTAIATTRTRRLGDKPTEQGAITPDAQAQVQGHVVGLFATEDAIRTRAASRLVVEWGNEPWVVPLLLAAGRAQIGDFAGVMNTLSVLEAMAAGPARLHETDVLAYLEIASARDPRIADEATKLRALLREK